MKQALTLLILLLGISISSQAQEIHTYRVEAGSYLDGNTWSGFKDMEGTITVKGDLIHIKVDEIKLDFSIELEAKDIVQTEGGDTILLMVAKGSDNPTLFGLVYCPHDDISLFRIVTPNSGLQFRFLNTKNVKVDSLL